MTRSAHSLQSPLLLALLFIAWQSPACSEVSCEETRTCGNPAAPSPTTEDGGSGGAHDLSAAGGTSGGRDTAAIGEACPADNARACLGPASSSVLLCDDGLWTLLRDCRAGELCDSRDPECEPIVPDCASLAPNATYCDASTLYKCGPDKVTTIAVRNCTNGCTDGACVSATGTGGDSGSPAEGGTAGSTEDVPSDGGTAGTVAVDPEDPCSAEPCEHGTCAVVGDTYECSCDAGYEGALCETNTDDCAPNPCENGGRCDDGVGGYECVCAKTFTGVNCELPRLELITNGPTAVNGDGSVIVGYGIDNDNKRWAYRWQNHLIERLEALPGEEESEAFDVSADGSVIVGQSGSRGALWMDGDIIPLDPLPGFENVYPSRLSADGSVAVGTSSNPLADTSVVTLWNKRTQPTDPGLGHVSYQGINGDGSIIVGYSFDGIAFRFANGTLEPLSVPTECTSARARATNRSGDTIAGSCFQAVGSRPIVWTNGVPSVLAPPPEAIWEQGYMELYALSADGKAGIGEAFNAADGDLMPVIWSAQEGMSWFRVVLREYGVDPSTYTRIDVEAISGDGRTVVGWLTDGVDWHGFIFRLD